MHLGCWPTEREHLMIVLVDRGAAPMNTYNQVADTSSVPPVSRSRRVSDSRRSSPLIEVTLSKSLATRCQTSFALSGIRPGRTTMGAAFVHPLAIGHNQTMSAAAAVDLSAARRSRVRCAF